MPKYAIVHPGKIGDLLYCLPTAKVLHEQDGAEIDIFTSELCKPAEKLIRYQSYVHDFIIPADYAVRDAGQGVQPWFMNVPSGYDRVYQLGYEHFPDGPLHLYTARRAGLGSVPNPSYECPDVKVYDEPYAVVAHCGHRSNPQLKDAYRDFMNRCPIKCVQVGIEADLVEGTSADLMIGLDLLETASLISKAKAYVGFYSGQLVIANGFPGLVKIVTMYPGVGEQHGLHIPITIDLPFATVTSITQTLQQYL